MRWIDNRQLTHMVDSARATAEHPGYIALQPIIDLIEVAIAWLSGKPQPSAGRHSRSSFPPPR